jgi:hypothetical protein
MKVRELILSAMILATLFTAGCARKDPPKTVHAAFVEKMKLCWFTGGGAVLAGYTYDIAPATIDTANGRVTLEQIAIVPNAGPAEEVFLVQFHAFNENTLIVTRSQTFPAPLAAYLKRDVATWLLERDGCAAPGTGSKDETTLASPDSAAPPTRLR